MVEAVPFPLEYRIAFIGMREVGKTSLIKQLLLLDEEDG